MPLSGWNLVLSSLRGFTPAGCFDPGIPGVPVIYGTSACLCRFGNRSGLPVPAFFGMFSPDWFPPILKWKTGTVPYTFEASTILILTFFGPVLETRAQQNRCN